MGEGTDSAMNDHDDNSGVLRGLWRTLLLALVLYGGIGAGMLLVWGWR